MADRTHQWDAMSHSGTVTALARHALQVVSLTPVRRTKVKPDLVGQLVKAVASADPDAGATAVAALKSAGIGVPDIIDLYIPEAAQILGTAWCEDTASFAEVTIGVSRLQGILRDIDPVLPYNPDAPTALVVLLQDAHHTLGGIVVASQLRRLGVSARLEIGRSQSEIANLARQEDFDMILVSASASEDLDNIHQLITALRRTMPRSSPIVLGGSILSSEDDVKHLSRADFIATNVRDAISQCGLSVSSRQATLNGQK